MMNFEQLNGKAINQAWWDFHRKNPHVYALFEKLAFQAIQKGKKKLSAKLIVNVIRWEHFLRTTDEEAGGFRINDAFHAYYGRYFMHLHKEHEGVFETRRLRARQEPTKK